MKGFILKHQIAKLHQKIARQRLDFTHKETAKLVKVAALIATEKLTVKNMTSSAKGTAEKHGKNVKQKAGLNREILNTAPAMTLNLLRYKAEEASSEFVEVPTKQVKPSQTCPDCGAKKKKTLADRWHSCDCGCKKPRDVASAQVNLNWALGIQAGNQPKKAA
ncbi:transposase [Vibrio cholerae]|uniref:RNA-guided endonuclease InsQ/TnpB family protein n=1 Tax=Vibrio cholerae TaxID=666 RepID=UPI003132AF58